MKNFQVNNYFFSILAFVGVIGGDQLSKWWARGQGSVVINQGVSFGLGDRGEVWVFVLLTCVVLVSLFFLFKEIWLKNLWVFGGLSGAAISNVIDRLWWGGVQDFLPVPVLNVQNNLADWVIFGCMVWITWQILFDWRSKEVETP